MSNPLQAEDAQTGSERLIWAQGSPSTLKAIRTSIQGVELTLAAAICWENYMPLLRFSLYSQNVNVYLAPTADARDTWLPLMRTIACESRAYVLSANQCVRRKHLPPWIRGTPAKEEAIGQPTDKDTQEKSADGTHSPPNQVSMPETPPPLAADKALGIPTPSPLRISSDSQATSPVKERTNRRRSSNLLPIPDNHFLALPAGSAVEDVKSEHISDSKASPPHSDDEFLSRGGSCIIGPAGEVLAGPLWEVEDGGLLIAPRIDFEDCERGRLDLDVAGSYSRNDAFELRVAGLNIDPPP